MVSTRGPGVWKLNNSLLSEADYVSEMKEKIPKWCSEAEQDLPDNIGSQWGFIKHKVGEFSNQAGFLTISYFHYLFPRKVMINTLNIFSSILAEMFSAVGLLNFPCSEIYEKLSVVYLSA